MGYFDGLVSSTLKTTADGHTLFLPFGALGRAYEVGSEADRARLSWQVKAWLITGIVFAIALKSPRSYSLSAASSSSASAQRRIG